MTSKVDVLTSLAVEHPTWSPKKLKEVFEKRGKQTVSMPVVYDALKRAKELLKPVTEEELAAATKELEVGEPNTQTREMEVEGKPDCKGNIDVSLPFFGQNSKVTLLTDNNTDWQTFDVAPKEMQQVIKVAQQLKEEKDLKDRLVAMTDLQKCGELAQLVAKMGVKEVRQLLLFVELLGIKVYNVVTFVEGLEDNDESV